MTDFPLPDAGMEQLSALIAEAIGLHFPAARRADLWRGIEASAGALGFESGLACAQGLLQRRALQGQEIEVLAANLTVGETYFLREPMHFRLLTQTVMPELMRLRERQGAARRLRLWSAACCTGEEAYSIAIWLHREMPALKGWQIEVIGSDLNPAALQHARAGVYGKWSFRDTPAWLQKDYFRPTAGGRFEILPAIARGVKFTPVNLAQDWPADPGIDVIFCRNVLMYFTPAQAQQTLARLYRAQSDDGWLIVGASEFLHLSDSPYAMERIGGTSVYCKQQRVPVAVHPSSPIAQSRPAPAKVLPVGPSSPLLRRAAAKETSLDMRQLADRGQWAGALTQCEAALRDDKSNPLHHYIRGLILREQGHPDAAAHSFSRALYLDPAFIMAHIATGYLDRDTGRMPGARRHFEQAAELLSMMAVDTVVPESDAMTAAQCLDQIRATGLSEVMA